MNTEPLLQIAQRPEAVERVVIETLCVIHYRFKPEVVEKKPPLPYATEADVQGWLKYIEERSAYQLERQKFYQIKSPIGPPEVRP